MTDNKIKVLVLMGGKSSEHEVSMLSGKEVVKNLDKSRYEIIPLAISKEGSGIEKITKIKPDVVFIALHGSYGEDGAIQGMLEAFGIPYTGPGVLASAIGIDKIVFRKLMRAEKLPIPRFIFLKKGDSMKSVSKMLGKVPYFVKPFNQGSSLGASPVKHVSELNKAINLAFKYSDIILIDEYLDGLELTCAVLGNKKPVALPVIEIHPVKSKFFDYMAKYSENGAKEIVPARISNTLTKKIQELAIKTYKTIGCKGFSRVDFILKNGKPVILEINTVPGLTPASLFPKAAKSAGISYPRLLDKIIEYATEKN